MSWVVVPAPRLLQPCCWQLRATLEPAPTCLLPRRTLGCTEGRSAATWCDFNLFGHQIVAHLVKGYSAAKSANQVDGDAVCRGSTWAGGLPLRASPVAPHSPCPAGLTHPLHECCSLAAVMLSAGAGAPLWGSAGGGAVPLAGGAAQGAGGAV